MAEDHDLHPVEHDPFAHTLTQVDHDPFDPTSELRKQLAAHQDHVTYALMRLVENVRKPMELTQQIVADSHAQMHKAVADTLAQALADGQAHMQGMVDHNYGQSIGAVRTMAHRLEQFGQGVEDLRADITQAFVQLTKYVTALAQGIEQLQMAEDGQHDVSRELLGREREPEGWAQVTKSVTTIAGDMQVLAKIAGRPQQVIHPAPSMSIDLDPVVGHVQRLADRMDQLVQEHGELRKRLTAPKRIVRDANGWPSAIVIDHEAGGNN